MQFARLFDLPTRRSGCSCAWACCHFFSSPLFIVFLLPSSQFLTIQNIVNVAPQSVYLVLVSLGQMIALLTGGLRPSVGTTIALTSVISAIIMTSLMAAMPNSIALIRIAGCLGAIAVALVIGLANGTGVAIFGVSPFIMTLGIQSWRGHRVVPHGRRASNRLSARPRRHVRFRSPVRRASAGGHSGLRNHRRRSIPLRKSLGRHLYAVGGNVKAAKLSGIDTSATLLIAYGARALLASMVGLLLTVKSGEANLLAERSRCNRLPLALSAGFRFAAA